MHRRDTLAAGCSGHRGRRLPGGRTRRVGGRQAWSHAWLGLLKNSPGSAGRPIPASEFDCSRLECRPPIRCLPAAARDWLESDGAPPRVPGGHLGPAAGLCWLRMERPDRAASPFCARCVWSGSRAGRGGVAESWARRSAGFGFSRFLAQVVAPFSLPAAAGPAS